MSERDVFVYVLGVRKKGRITGPVKVGISADPPSRLTTLQTGCPDELILIKTVRLWCRQNAQSIESVFHEINVKHKRHGEWFDLTPDVAVVSLVWCLSMMVALNEDDANHSAIMCATGAHSEVAA